MTLKFRQGVINSLLLLGSDLFDPVLSEIEAKVANPSYRIPSLGMTSPLLLSVSSADVIAVGALWSFWCDMLYDTNEIGEGYFIDDTVNVRYISMSEIVLQQM